MSASSKIGDEFFYTLGCESNDSKTHWLCFASQKYCELHFKFNEKFKEVSVIFRMPNEFKLQFSSSFPSTSMYPSFPVFNNTGGGAPTSFLDTFLRSESDACIETYNIWG